MSWLDSLIQLALENIAPSQSPWAPFDPIYVINKLADGLQLQAS